MLNIHRILEALHLFISFCCGAGKDQRKSRPRMLSDLGVRHASCRNDAQMQMLLENAVCFGVHGKYHPILESCFFCSVPWSNFVL